MYFRLPSHLSPEEARTRLDVVYREEGARLAEGLALIALIDSRGDYRAAGYSCMKSYCTGHLRMSPDRAAKRLHVARTACRFPRLFECIADGRLSLGAAAVLATHLADDCADELLAWSAHKTREEIAQMLAARARRAAQSVFMTTSEPVATVASALDVSDSSPQHAPGHPVPSFVAQVAPSGLPQRGHGLCSPAPVHVAPARRGRITPGAPGEHEVRLTLTQKERDDLQRVQELLSNTDWAHDPAAIYARAIQRLEEHLLKNKLGAGSGADAAERVGKGRRIPMAVRRAVWERDGGCCTFVSPDGHRCGERRWLQFDHRIPVAEGGASTVENVRLLCRAHNQYEAERVLGQARMSRARDRAERERQRTQDYRRREAERAAKREAKARAEAEAAALQARDGDLISALRTLGFSREEASRGAAASVSHASEPLERRLPVALRALTKHLGKCEDFREAVDAKSAAA